MNRFGIEWIDKWLNERWMNKWACGYINEWLIEWIDVGDKIGK